MGKDKASKRSRESLVQDIVQSDAVKKRNRPAKDRSRQSDNVDQVFTFHTLDRLSIGESKNLILNNIFYTNKIKRTNF